MPSEASDALFEEMASIFEVKCHCGARMGHHSTRSGLVCQEGHQQPRHPSLEGDDGQAVIAQMLQEHVELCRKVAEESGDSGVLDIARRAEDWGVEALARRGVSND